MFYQVKKGGKIVANIGLSLLAVAALSACGSGDTKDTAAEGPSYKQSAEGYAGLKKPPSMAGDRALYKKITEPEQPLNVGMAMDIENQEGIITRCIEGTVEEVPVREGFFSVDAEFSRDYVEEALGVRASGGVRFLNWGASSRASFHKSMREEKRKLNYMAFSFYKANSLVFIPTRRSEQYQNYTSEEWRAHCGSGYVGAQDRGAMLLIKFSLDLHEKSEVQTWGGSASGNYLSIATLRASISKYGKKLKSGGTLSVSALQIGGKPYELGKILTNINEKNGKGLVESFALCQVNEKEWEKCLAGLRSIENYMSTVFPAQFEGENASPGTIINHYPFPYPKAIGGDFDPAIDSFVLDARKDLTDLYDAEQEDAIVLASAGKDDDAELNELAGKIAENLNSIRQAINYCYSHDKYEQCTKRSSELKTACAATVVPQWIQDGGSADSSNSGSSGE